MKSTYILAATAVLAAAGFIATKWPLEEVDQAKVQPRTAQQSVAPAIQSTTLQVTGKPNPVTTKISVSSKLQKQFAEAKDYRVFALDALQRPSEGGYFYAIRAAQTCHLYNDSFYKSMISGGKQDALDMKGTLKSEGLKEAELQAIRCNSFTTKETEEFTKMVEDKARDGTDPVYKTRLSFIDTGYQMRLANEESIKTGKKATLTPEFLESAQKLLDLKDPLVFANSGGINSISRSIAKLSPDDSTWFDGEEFKRIKNVGYNYPGLELYYAMELSVCKIGKNCDSEMSLKSRCARQLCNNSVEEMIRENYMHGGGTEEGFQRILALEKRTTVALQNADLNAFLPPQYRKPQ